MAEYGIFDRAWQSVLGCREDQPCGPRCWLKPVIDRLAHSPDPKVRSAHEGLVQIVHHFDTRNGSEGETLRWTGTVRLNEPRLLDPLRWRKPVTVATGFHGDWGLLSDEERDRMLAVTALCPHLEFFTLTKRPENLGDYFGTPGRDVLLRQAWKSVVWFNAKPLPKTVLREFPQKGWPQLPMSNVWIGTSASNQAELDARAPHLMKLAAAGWSTFVFLEPLVGPVDVREHLGVGTAPIAGECIDIDGNSWHKSSERCRECGHGMPRLSWVVIGCESGPLRRPDHHDWCRSLIAQCKDAGVPCWVKQIQVNGRVSREPGEWPEDLRVRQMPEVRCG